MGKCPSGQVSQVFPVTFEGIDSLNFQFHIATSQTHSLNARLWEVSRPFPYFQKECGALPAFCLELKMHMSIILAANVGPRAQYIAHLVCVFFCFSRKECVQRQPPLHPPDFYPLRQTERCQAASQERCVFSQKNKNNCNTSLSQSLMIPMRLNAFERAKVITQQRCTR